MNYNIKNKVRLNCIKSNKFKDICISINFISENEQMKATLRTLLSMMFVDRCEKYDTKKKMNDICDHLYGCIVGSRVISYGKGHCLEIRSKIINPIYIHENHNILNDWFNLLHEIIFYPLLNESVFEENKKILESRIKRREDDNQIYTISKLFDLIGKDQPISIISNGDLISLNQSTLNDIKNQYYDLIHNNQIEIIICGDFNENQIMKYIQSKFIFEQRYSQINTHYVIDVNDSKIKIEEKNQIQTNVAILYSTGIDVKDIEYAALKVANGIFGQMPTSLLFRTIREEYSLCYSISSSLISFDGVCLITTSIEKENINQTIELINTLLDKCKNGEFDDDLLEITKQMLINTLNSSLDDMSSIIGYAFTNNLLERNFPIEKNIESIMKVTKENCINVFKKMKHLGTYVCKSKEEFDE